MINRNIWVFATAVFISIFTGSCRNEETREIDCAGYVNPFIGTADNGHTFPGAALPFGLIQAGPDNGRTEWKYCSGYNYADTIFYGFSQDHLNGTGCPDLGDILLLPFTGNTNENIYSAGFSKETEKAVPGYYRVTLSNFNVDVEITATNHTAFHKYTFRKQNARILLDLQSGITGDTNMLRNHVLHADFTIENNRTISGHNLLKGWVTRDLFYVIEFDRPFKVTKTLPKVNGEKAQRWLLAFNVKPGDAVQVKVALSTTGINGARANMKAENAGWDFNMVRQKAYDAWNAVLSKVQIEGTRDQKESFYTSLYHLFLQPNNIADVDGKYRGADDSIHTSFTGNHYSTLSLWDTYRAAHPLYTILAPEMVGEFIKTMLDQYDQQGFLPIWSLWGKENYCMIGNHAVPVIVDAYLKGYKDFDPERAYKAVKTSLTVNHLNSSWDIYDKYGYYPYDKIAVESVSRTLESAYDDYCAAQFAKALGHTADCEFFTKRSNYYKNLFDPQTKLMRGKDSSGGWRRPFNTLLLSHASTSGGDYTEGNAWQYTWQVQHDVDGLIKLMGGNDYYTRKLDSLFTMNNSKEGNGFVMDVTGLIGQYAHGNEPGHHVEYLYALAGKPWRTQELIHETIEKFYINKPDGLCGNDDCGQMSAWYIFSVFGFYPVNPCGGEYVLGAPQVKKAIIALPEGKSFTVEAINFSKVNIFVQWIELNGTKYKKNSISHYDIMKGGILKFIMGNKKVE